MIKLETLLQRSVWHMLLRQQSDLLLVPFTMSCCYKNLVCGGKPKDSLGLFQLGRLFGEVVKEEEDQRRTVLRSTFRNIG